MKKTIFACICSALLCATVNAQTIWGESGSRTEYRNDAGLQGNAGAISGFYQTPVPVNYPAGAGSWWHLLDVRHSNPDNNYTMQFAGSFFDQHLWFRKTNNNPSHPWSRVLLETGGRTGIGTLNPTEALHVVGNIRADNILLGSGTTVSSSGRLHISGEEILYVLNKSGVTIGKEWGGTGDLRVQGNTTIGPVTSTPAGYSLYVANGILTERVKVAIKTSANWSDYVFDKNYPLMPLAKLEKYIEQNKHLPGIPSATEAVKEGIDLAEMNAKLLAKIEELTLHMIAQDKRNAEQEMRISSITEKLAALQQQVQQGKKQSKEQ
jgi:hypothetical protein